MHSPLDCRSCPIHQVLSNLPKSIQTGIKELFPFISDDSTVSYPTWVKQHGVAYKPDSFVVTGADGTDQSLDTFSTLSFYKVQSYYFIYYVVQLIIFMIITMPVLLKN